MKRKILSILFVLVLVVSFSLVTQVIPTALASPDLLPEVEFQVDVSSSAEWTTEREYAGTYSVLLTTLYPTSLSQYARVATPYGDTLDSISSISYWEYYVKDWPEFVTELWGVYVSIELDTGTYTWPPPGTLTNTALDGVADHWLMGDPHLQDGFSTPSTWPQIWNDWVQRTFDDDAYFWSPIDGNEMETTYQLSSWKEGTTGVATTISATSKVLKIKLPIGEGIAGEGWPAGAYKNVYVDDLGINGTIYELEPRVVNLDTMQGFNTIQAAIDAAGTGDTINMATGTYDPFTVDTKTSLTIQSSSVVTVQGVQSVATAYTDRDCVVFVKDSTNIVLDDLNIQGQNLGTINTKNYGVIYENSSGEIKDCTVSPNTIGDMDSVAIGIWDGSTVTVDPCTIENFGRVGMLVYNACTVEVLDSTIIGQVYSGEGEVCYGIEVEGAYNDDTPATASQVTIRGNEIYNCDTTFYEAPTDMQSGGIYINGWLEWYPGADSTVIVENNDIHDNYSGIIVIKSSLSYAHYNNIYDNRAFGVENLLAHDDSTAVFDAENNWWGDCSGPYHYSTNTGGLGDEVSDNVDYEPWRCRSVVYPWRPAPPPGGGGPAPPDTTPPRISNVLLCPEGVTETTADICWTTHEKSTSQVEYWTSPSMLSPLDETLVIEHHVKLTGLTPGAKYYYKTMSMDRRDNLAVSDEYTFTTLGKPPAAAFTSSDLSISPTEVDIGEEVTISVLVNNTGNASGSYEVTLKIDGVVAATKEVTLKAGASEEVIFSTAKDVAGSYSVEVSGLIGSFTVKEVPLPPAPPVAPPAPPPPAPPVAPPPPGVNWAIFGPIIGVLVFLAIFLTIRLRKRRRAA